MVAPGGEVDAAFAAADHVVTGTYALPRLVAAPIETRGAIAEYDAGHDQLTVWCSAQDPHRPRAQLAHILKRPDDTVRVIVPDVGGAFGSKGVIAPEVAALAAAAIKLGRPLKWAEDRLENFLAAYQGRGIEGDLELALSGDGRMLAVRARLWADLGGYLLSTTAIPPHTAAMLMTGCYDIASRVGAADRRAHAQGADRPLPRRRPTRRRLHARAARRPGGGRTGNRPHRAAPAQPGPPLSLPDGVGVRVRLG